MRITKHFRYTIRIIFYGVICERSDLLVIFCQGMDICFYDAVDLSNTIPRDGHGHGTHVAGIVAGQTNGIGVAPGVDLVICRAMDDNGVGSDVYLTRCAEFAANAHNDCTWLNPVGVWSASLGAQGEYTWFDDAATILTVLDVLPVFSAGNHGQEGCGTINYPGSNPNVLTVGAVSCDSLVTYFSSRGPVNPSSCTDGCCEYSKPDIAGPGDRIVSAYHLSNDGYVVKSGTSMATPHVAAVAAIYLSVPGNEGTTAEELKRIMIATTNKPVSDGSPGCTTCGNYTTRPNNEVGYGMVDALTAVYYNSSAP
jgi:subtilisin family serine protease